MFEFTFAEQQFCALPSGGLWHVGSETLIVADLHLGKGQSFATEGNLLPPYDDRATLRDLASDIQRLNPQRVWLLGDSFHRVDSPDRVEAIAREELQQLSAGSDWLWVMGNHDGAPLTSGIQWLPGEVCDQVQESDILFSHHLHTDRPWNVFGHYHPKATVQLQGLRVTGKCFFVSETRLLCPAYGAFTGGLYWPEAPLNELFDDARFLLCYKNQVTEVRQASLVKRKR